MSMGAGVGMGMLELGREMEGALQVEVGVGRGGQSGTSALTHPSPVGLSQQCLLPVQHFAGQ